MQYFQWFLFSNMLQVFMLVLVALTTDIALRGRFFSYGWDFVSEWISVGTVRVDDVAFPRLAKCTIEHFGKSGTLQRIDYLCFLGASCWYGRVFFMLWWWYIIAIFINILGIMYDVISVVFLLSNKFKTPDHRNLSCHDALFLMLLRRTAEPVQYRYLV